jgi:hypothetical protein
MLQLRANANTTKITVADPRTMSPPANTPRIGPVPDGHDHLVTADDVLGSLDRDRTAASRRIRFTELHPHAAQPLTRRSPLTATGATSGSTFRSDNRVTSTPTGPRPGAARSPKTPMTAPGTRPGPERPDRSMKSTPSGRRSATCRSV